MSLPLASMVEYTLTDLGLIKINEILLVIFNNKVLSNSMSTTDANEISLKQFVFETMNEAANYIEKCIQTYAEIANVEKRKILNQETKFKTLPTVQSVLNVIENRQKNMILSAHYHTAQIMKIIFQE